MKRIKTTPLMKKYLGLIQLAVPMTALEVLLCSQNPWWIIPVRPLILWCLGVEAIIAPVSFLLARGRRWPWPLLWGLLSSWVGLSVIIAFKLKSSALALFTLGILLVFGLLFRGLWMELNRSYAFPNVRWYERRPKALPGVSGQLVTKDKAVSNVEFARLDLEGAFVFGCATSESELSRGPVQVYFEMMGKRFEVPGEVVVDFGREGGLGIRFVKIDADQREDILHSIKQWQRRMG